MKKMRMLILVFILFLSCSDNEDCCSLISGNDTLFEFSVVNQNEEDLLNANITNTYNSNSIKLYNLINGNEVLINIPNSDMPNGYTIFTKDGLNLIRTFFDESSLIVNGIIEWNVNNRDTISLEMVQQSENVKRLIKIKYNNKIVWDEETASNPDYRYFQIIK